MKSGVRLQRDHGLATIRKDIIALFKGLSLTIKTNLIERYFLDLTCILGKEKYFPFQKVTNTRPFPTTTHLQSSNNCLN